MVSTKTLVIPGANLIKTLVFQRRCVVRAIQMLWLQASICKSQTCQESVEKLHKAWEASTGQQSPHMYGIARGIGIFTRSPTAGSFYVNIDK